MIIYKATNIIDGKSYIGQTTNSLKHRVNQHIRETNYKKRKNTYFHNALNYYGVENFTFIIIDIAESVDDLNRKEEYWIKFYNSTNKQCGYNLDSGGKNCSKSESTKAKIGRKKKENWEDENLRYKMQKGLEKATQVWKSICPREIGTIICKNCNKQIELSLWESKIRKFCSNQCANSFNIKKATTEASVVNHNRCVERYCEIKNYVLNWALLNKSTIAKCKMNRIGVHMKPLINSVYNNFGIKDLRTISKAVVGESSKREFVKYLKEYII